MNANEKQKAVEDLLDAFRETFSSRVAAPDADKEDWYTIASEFFLSRGATRELAHELGRVAAHKYKYWG